jgi:hypothetical protein
VLGKVWLLSLLGTPVFLLETRSLAFHGCNWLAFLIGQPFLQCSPKALSCVAGVISPICHPT